MRACAGDDGDGRGAAVAKGVVEGCGYGGDVGLADAEGGGGETDLLDEVGDLGGVEVHEHVDLGLGLDAHVGGEAGGAEAGAAEEGAEVLVEVGEENVLVRALHAGGEGVGDDGGGSSTVEEVEGNGRAVAVGGLQTAVEVGEEVDGLAVVGSRCENTRNIDFGTRKGRVGSARSSEVTDAHSVDQQRQKSVLVCSSVIGEKGSSVLVTDGHGSILRIGETGAYSDTSDEL